MLLNKIKDINLALDNKSYLSALALTLTLPDICGKIEYPNYINKNGTRRGRKQYEAWFDNWVNQYYANNEGWTADSSKAINPIFTGEMCYSLRCSFLHEGNADIKSWGDQEDEEFFYYYEFSLVVNGADSVGEFWLDKEGADLKDTKIKTVRINIEKLCHAICFAAENYYEEKGSGFFKDNKLYIVDFKAL